MSNIIRASHGDVPMMLVMSGKMGIKGDECKDLASFSSLLGFLLGFDLFISF